MKSSDQPLISCLCPTRNRQGLLQQAIRLFSAQSYPNLEMVIACDSDDPASQDLVRQSGDPRLNLVVGPPPEIMTLGAKRNNAIAAANGEYIAVWDDDDWYHVDRIARQYNCLLENKKDACVIAPIVLCNLVTEKTFLGTNHLWENTLLAKKISLPRYLDRGKGGDSPVIMTLFKQNALSVLRDPRLYTYIFHGSNTWEQEHWNKNLIPKSIPLGEEESKKILNTLLPLYARGL